jgi:hypothetical protein
MKLQVKLPCGHTIIKSYAYPWEKPAIREYAKAGKYHCPICKAKFDRRYEQVLIYEDPMTEKQPEGLAKLLERLDSDSHPDLEYWKVRFIDDDFLTERWIKKSKRENPISSQEH